jgi:hypothetical protein
MEDVRGFGADLHAVLLSSATTPAPAPAPAPAPQPARVA